MGDSNWSNVKLLLGFEGSDGSTTFTDEGPNALTGTASSNAQIDTSAFKFGSSSYLGDGSGDVVSFSDRTDWYFPSEFTIECWVRPDFSSIGIGGFLSQWTNIPGGCNFQFWYFYSSSTSKSFRFTYSPTGGTSGTTLSQTAANIDQSVFHHVAVDRDASDKIRLYVDGVMVASATVSGGTDVATSLLVGANQSPASSSWKGWIDELRITKGVARYASDSGFSVPTAAFPRGVGDIEVSAAQSIPTFSQSATATVDVVVTVSQTVPAFGQNSRLSSLPDRDITVAQTIDAFTQTATLAGEKLVVVAQTIPAFSQTTTLTVECVVTVSQTIPAFLQSAILRRGDATPGLIFRGVIGGCSINRAGLATLEARSILTLGRGFLSERFCAQCRADLYDARCKVSKDAFSASATVASVLGQFKFTVTSLPDGRAVNGWYDLGQAVITSGDSNGEPFQIKTWTEGTLTVEAMTPIDELLDVGDTLTLYAGCDKTSTTCRDKFSNMINYRGEEYAAGRDLQLTTTGS